MKKLNPIVTILVSFFATSTALGMKAHKQSKECLRHFTTLPSDDVKQKIQHYILQNAITFLSEQPLTLPNNINFGSSIAITIDENDLIISEYGNPISTWNLMTSELKHIAQKPNDTSGVAIKILHNLKSKPLPCAPIIDKNRIIVGLHSKKVLIIDSHTEEVIDIFETKDTITDIAPYNDTVLIGSSRHIEIWNIATNTSKIIKTNMVTMVAALYDDQAAIMGQRGMLKIWNINTGELLKTIKNFTYNHGGAFLALNDRWVVAISPNDRKAWPLSLNLRGTPKDNPLLWIKENADIAQGDFIRRACQTTMDRNNFILALPKKFGAPEDNESKEEMDCRIYFTLPFIVRAYLRNCLNIKARKAIPQSEAI